MTDKITLTDLVNLENQTTAVNGINNNNATIIGAINNTVSRDGTQPNTMGADFDMNSHRVLNLPAPVSDFEPIRMIDVSTINSGGITVSPLPAGGTTGQQLTKNSNTNFDTSWKTNQPVITGGSTNQVLSKTSNADFALGWTNAVTSVGVTTPADITVTNTPITTTGNINLAWTTNPTGTGAVVRQNSPTIATPNIAQIVNVGTLTLPNTTDTIVGRATTDTLTNKSIAASQLTGALQAAQFPALVGDVTTNAASLTTAISSNAVTNGQAAQMAAFTIKGNATGSTANSTDISIPALTQKSTPISGDMVLLVDSAASNALKFATAGSLASVGSVASVGGLLGTITLGPGLTTSGNSIQDDPAMIGEVRMVAFNRVPTNFIAADGSTKTRTGTFAALFAALVVSSTVSMTIASPCVVTWTGNALQNNDPILLTTTGALPTGLTVATKYYVKGLSGNTFNLSATPGGAAINTSGSQSGTHTGTNAPWEGTSIGNGSTTFTLPNLNGQFLRGIDQGAGVDSSRSFGTSQSHALQTHNHAGTVSIQQANYAPSTGGSAVLIFGGATSLSIGNNTGNSTTETRPVNQTLLYVIRYQ